MLFKTKLEWYMVYFLRDSASIFHKIWRTPTTKSESFARQYLLEFSQLYLVFILNSLEFCFIAVMDEILNTYVPKLKFPFWIENEK